MSRDEEVSPSAAEWLALAPAERMRVIAALPTRITPEELAAEEEEGDDHREECNDSVDALRRFFRSAGRRAYVSSNLIVFYPRERRFAPDLLVVLDVDDHRRNRWLVVDEGKGLDFALEIVAEGDRNKDLRDNVVRYGRLGIPEYVVFDLRRAQLHAFRLEGEDAREYTRVPLEDGRFRSRVLGLDLRVEGARVRFLVGSALLPASSELVERLEHEMAAAHAKIGEEARAREAAEEEVARMRRELEQLRGRGQ